MIKRVLAVASISAVGVLGASAIPAGATNIGPNVNLKEKSGVLKFSPKTLNLVQGKGKKCKSTNYSFSVTNKTSSTETIDDGGTPFIVNLAAGSEAIVCQGVGTATYTVDGDTTGATLTVTVSS